MPCSRPRRPVPHPSRRDPATTRPPSVPARRDVVAVVVADRVGNG